MMPLWAVLQDKPGLRGQFVRSLGGVLPGPGAAPAPKRRAPPGRFRQSGPPAARSRLSGRTGDRLGGEWATGYSDEEDGEANPDLAPQDAEMFLSDGAPGGEQGEEEQDLF